MDKRFTYVTGTVDRWFQTYGFIKTASGSRYVFHDNAVADYTNGPIIPGQQVQFRIKTKQAGHPEPKATDVTRVMAKTPRRRHRTVSWRAE